MNTDCLYMVDKGLMMVTVYIYIHIYSVCAGLVSKLLKF